MENPTRVGPYLIDADSSVIVQTVICRSTNFEQTWQNVAISSSSSSTFY